MMVEGRFRVRLGSRKLRVSTGRTNWFEAMADRATVSTTTMAVAAENPPI